MTPEGKVKDHTKKMLLSEGLVPSGKAALATAKNTGWYHMPVTNGMGVVGIPDFYGHYRGFFWEIETKIPGKDPTALQAQQLHAAEITGAATFVIRGEKDLDQVRLFFRRIDALYTKGLTLRPEDPPP